MPPLLAILGSRGALLYTIDGFLFGGVEPLRQEKFSLCSYGRMRRGGAWLTPVELPHGHVEYGAKQNPPWGTLFQQPNQPRGKPSLLFLSCGKFFHPNAFYLGRTHACSSKTRGRSLNGGLASRPSPPGGNTQPCGGSTAHTQVPGKTTTAPFESTLVWP